MRKVGGDARLYLAVREKDGRPPWRRIAATARKGAGWRSAKARGATWAAAAFLVAQVLAGTLPAARDQRSPASIRQDPPREASRWVMVERGVLRWSDTGEEVALFGVNYYAPFSLDYHAIRRLGGDPRREIDRDLAHLVRLGVGLLRMHVFDREISDADGNVIANEHLDLCDYLVHRCKAAGIYVLLTPIAWWWTPNSSGGFSSRYSMRQMTSEPSAIAAQTRYLTQFMSRVNPYTGLPYAADPAIIAVEPINEPVYPAGMTDTQVRAYIDALAGAIRRAGCRKPILYNGWQERHAAVRDASVDGCTFNWYPTGLLNGHSLRWNILPLLDRHPEMHDPILEGKVKAVYEFDAADVSLSCVYPAMARALRAGGAQLAAQFQYDPVLTAGMNLSWQTHYLNLCCTPAKAISLLIAAEAFRQLPRGGISGGYPRNRSFGVFEVDFQRDLSVMNAPDRYCYSGSTAIRPRDPRALRHIAGCGSSPLVQYSGSGAYFLDRISAGIWQLEVYPDAVPAHDPYGHPYVGREVVRLVHRSRRMAVHLPDLGPKFLVFASDGSVRPSSNAAGAFTVRPGVYRLVRHGIRDVPPAPLKTAWLPPGDDAPAAWHQPPDQWVEGQPLPVSISVVEREEPQRVDLVYLSSQSQRRRVRRMWPVGACRYATTIPGPMVRAGSLHYEIKVTTRDGAHTYPSGAKWGSEAREVELLHLSPDVRLELASNLAGLPRRSAKVIPGPSGGRAAVRIDTDGPLPRPRFGETGIVDTWVTLSFVTAASHRTLDHSALSVCLRSTRDTTAVQVGLREPDGTFFAADVPVTARWREVVIPLYRFEGVDRRGWGRTIRTIRAVSFSLLGRLTRSDGPQSVDVAWARVQPLARVWEVPVVRAHAPVRVFAASRHEVWTGSPESHDCYLVSGADGRTLALRIAARDLGLVVGFRRDCSDSLFPRRDNLEKMRHVRIRARWCEQRISPVQLALIETDGTPWGADVPVSPLWRDITVPLTSFRHLAEWRTGPSHRGGRRDGPRLNHLAALNVAYGAWLDPDHASEPHTLDIEEIALQP